MPSIRPVDVAINPSSRAHAENEAIDDVEGSVLNDKRFHASSNTLVLIVFDSIYENILI